jgi:SAM-dependent methyltransferase
MAEMALPPDDEPFDFRRQAATYGRYRRDYSAGLYDVIAEHTGAAAGRFAVDLGCGTGFVASTLTRRGWRAVGVDFSAPMLAQARTLAVVQARTEHLPLRDGSTALVTAGTAFHWFAPAPALREITRVLAPGGWVALFWRYPRADEPSNVLIRGALAEIGRPVPPDLGWVHPPAPFSGASRLEPVPPQVLQSTISYTPDAFLGWAATLEWVRRIAGPEHRRLLGRLRTLVAERHPGGFEERNEEHLFLARRRAS